MTWSWLDLHLLALTAVFFYWLRPHLNRSSAHMAHAYLCPFLNRLLVLGCPLKQTCKGQSSPLAHTPMDESHFPLRWESTGDQWWYASPIDWAAANGHYNVVRELLHLDANLLIKLTSLRRIHRLESVWDDDMRFVDAARNRSFIARCLLLDCESCGRTNRLVCAGYGGWLLYTASSAGDAGFVQELLERQPLLVFGEGEYGVTDILYAAARSRSSEVFRLLLDSVLSPRCLTGEARGEILEELRNEGSCGSGPNSMFRLEMMNRAMHAAARGGNLEVLRELLKGCSDASAYRDAQGSTILHTASAKGQVEVVKDLIASFNIVNSTDDQGNTALHIAAFRGHLPVIEALVTASLSLISVTNEVGDTLLHMALTGFRTPGFRRLDHQMELMKKLIGGVIMDIHDIINARNDDGRTVLHLAVVGNVHSDLVELLMTAPSIDLNVHDNDGMTPLDLLRKQPRSASSEILIKQLILAGGISNLKDHEMRSAIASQLKMQCIVGSPGTAFRISDAEIFLHAGIDASGISERTSSFSSAGRNPVQNVTKHLKILLKWPRHKGKSAGGLKELQNDDSSLDSVNSGSKVETPTPLRQRYSKVGSMFNNKQTLATKSSTPSPATKKKFTVGLMHGVIQTMPHLLPPSESPSLSVSRSSPSLADKIEGIHLGNDQPSPSKSGFNSNTPPKKYGSLNSRLMNQYFCLGAQGLTVEDSTTEQRSNRMIKRSLLSVA